MEHDPTRNKLNWIFNFFDSFIIFIILNIFLHRFDIFIVKRHGQLVDLALLLMLCLTADKTYLKLRF